MYFSQYGPDIIKVEYHNNSMKTMLKITLDENKPQAIFCLCKLYLFKQIKFGEQRRYKHVHAEKGPVYTDKSNYFGFICISQYKSNAWSTYLSMRIYRKNQNWK